MADPWISGKITERTVWAEGLWSLQFDAQLEPFEAGQWLNVALGVDGERVRRAYSLASPPGAPPELFLVRVDGASDKQ